MEMAGRGVGVALLIVLALAAGAPRASAVIAHLSNGTAIGYTPLRGASTLTAPASTLTTVTPFDEFFHNLDYNGGSVMTSNTNYAIYWDPSGAPAYPSEYQSGINQYFEDLAHDSGGHENVDSVSAQYNDAAGELANYDSHFGGALIDTDPYPANGCTKATICLTDSQIRAELASYLSAQMLPTDLAHEYFVLTPPGVESCVQTGECSAGSSEPFYCAYHGNIPVSGGEIIYANIPYMTGNTRCDDGNHPNGTTSDGALQGGLVHEHNDSITDPEPNTAWTDFASGEQTGFEVADKCRTFTESTELAPRSERPRMAPSTTR